jgi:casein kinase II subunit beta
VIAAIFKNDNFPAEPRKLSKTHFVDLYTGASPPKMSWLDKVLSRSGFDYLCKVDEDFLSDKFNLTGLEREIPNFKQTYEALISSSPPGSDTYDICLHLYGLIHARFIISASGLVKMSEKYLAGQYGQCPRLLCKGTKLLPVGLSDRPGTCGVKLYCPACEDVYSPKSMKHNSVDGAYFGTSFPHLFLLTYHPLDIIPYRRYQPLLFGFKCLGDFSKITAEQQPQ